MTRKASKRAPRARRDPGVPFRGLLGDSTEARVLRALLSDPWHDFMKLELAKEARVTRPSLDRVWKTFLEYEMVFEVRKLGRVRTYRLNEANPLVADLQRFAKDLARILSERAQRKGRARKAARSRGERPG